MTRAIVIVKCVFQAIGLAVASYLTLLCLIALCEILRGEL